MDTPQLVKFSKEVSEFIESISTKIGDEWFYIPMWFKKQGEQVFSLHTFDKLPDELKKEILNHRKEIPELMPEKRK